MHAMASGWIRYKTAVLGLVGVTAGGLAGSLALPQSAFAMTVPVPVVSSDMEPGFSIVFDLDFVDNVLRVTLPRRGIVDVMNAQGTELDDVLTLVHPLDVLDEVVVGFVPGRGVSLRFDSALETGGGGTSGPSTGGSVPEPASAALLGLGLVAQAWRRRLRRT